MFKLSEKTITSESPKEQLKNQLIYFWNPHNVKIIGYGFIVKVYDNGNCFVKVISDNQEFKNKCDNWNRYGIRDNTGLFIEKGKGYQYTVINNYEDLRIDFDHYSYKITNNKHVEISSNQFNLSEMNSYTESLTDYYWIQLDSEHAFTYAYSNKYNVGSWQKGCTDSSFKRAAIDLQIKILKERKESIV